MLILKSESPRRIEILKSLGLKFEISPAKINEGEQNEKPIQYLERVTSLKLEQEKYKDGIHISSDTIVVFEGKILHKPKSELEAFEILSKLNDKTHSVFSGLGIFDGKKKYFGYDETEVHFWKWSKADREFYIKEMKPFDKAGSYGIQDLDSPVKTFRGSYLNVLGFPIRRFYENHNVWSEFLV
jgi:septum formation protein